MENCKINWTEDWDLSEIYSGGMQMALCSPPNENGEYQKATTFVTCKDFFQDAVQASHLGKKQKIYDFVYDPKTAPPLSFDRFRILIANNLDNEMESKIENVLDFINQFEKQIHLIRTKAYKCINPPEKWNKSGVYLFEGSSRWLQAPPMISLYTLLLRCGFVHNKGDDFDKTCQNIISGKCEVGNKSKRYSGCYDDRYLKSSQSGINAIKEHGYARLFYKDAARNFPKEIPINTMHDQCGIVGFSQKKIKDYMPYWYRLMKDPADKKVAAVVKKKPAVKKAKAKNNVDAD